MNCTACGGAALGPSDGVEAAEVNHECGVITMPAEGCLARQYITVNLPG